MKRDIVLYPDNILLKKTDDIVEFDTKVAQLVIDMFETMTRYKGVGLAAPQIGKSISILVYKTEAEEKYMINPVMLDIDEEVKHFQNFEQCLSFPNVQVRLPRQLKIKVKYSDTDGDERVLEAEGAESAVIQHEMDHLQGQTLLNHLSYIQRDILKRKVKKLSKQQKKLQGQMI